MGHDHHPDPVDWLEKYGDYLYGFALLRVRDSVEAEELVQTSLAVAARTWPIEQEREPEVTRLESILHRQIIDRLHQRARDREAAISIESGDADLNLFQTEGEFAGHWREGFAPVDWPLETHSSFKARLLRGLGGYLSCLPGTTATAFVLREIDGLSVEDICDVLHVSRPSLWRMLNYARLHISHSFQRESFIDERYLPAIMTASAELSSLDQAIGNIVAAA